MRWALACLTLLLGGTADARPTLDEAVAQFRAVAFGDDFNAIAGVLLKRRPGEVRFGFLAGEIAALKPHATEIARAFDEIQELTGRRFVERKSDNPPFVITARNRKDFRSTIPAGFPDADEIARTSACFALYLQQSAGTIDRVVIVIGADISEARRRHCIQEEIVQSFGLVADACRYRPSLFCEADRHLTGMTPTDRLLLKTLYDPRLKAGMTETEAMPIVRTVLRELW